MQEFAGRVAVVTGAGSGIGRALARQFAAAGMKLVLADIEPAPLEAVREELRTAGTPAIAQTVDVSRAADIDALAERAFSEFGAVHILCNNAGVLHRNKPAWEHTVADWRWVLDVNLWGVIHGLRAFVPAMLERGEEGHIVNTASMAGLITGGIGTAPYDASKHAVLSLTESLYKDLRLRQAKLSASVLCPGAVDTNIFEADRNRASEYGPSEGEPATSRVTAAQAGESVGGALAPAEVAQAVFEAIQEDRFYVLAAQSVIFEWVKMGHDRMWEGRNPAVPRRSLL
jgi:NAD(P)-dependent dehydrogenase (short-subunit alcohol dehydrogenase family)